ncbi:hypothetical protein H4R33_004654 [Dimargaris cristalligena]|uniref:Uncharacterized protein n=1 Tax=Dimargaris cristalligena TaxID=215637 RepID=A0A4V1J4B2_9FUNG|nr:hypothetical protein H4R33_004654 [Dimargaris cristalligena]RKP34949.1 hypothetical protein BJ085DRAFT_35268 [Dimargaris cristalligena]|eukprot:RKP34949.1 hypothetical protein BJ085DRAFT_35268 [Dimargaris cristalligena]
MTHSHTSFPLKRSASPQPFPSLSGSETNSTGASPKRLRTTVGNDGGDTAAGPQWSLPFQQSPTPTPFPFTGTPFSRPKRSLEEDQTELPPPPPPTDSPFHPLTTPNTPLTSNHDFTSVPAKRPRWTTPHSTPTPNAHLSSPFRTAPTTPFTGVGGEGSSPMTTPYSMSNGSRHSSDRLVNSQIVDMETGEVLDYHHPQTGYPTNNPTSFRSSSPTIAAWQSECRNAGQPLSLPFSPSTSSTASPHLQFLIDPISSSTGGAYGQNDVPPIARRLTLHKAADFCKPGPQNALVLYRQPSSLGEGGLSTMDETRGEDEEESPKIYEITDEESASSSSVPESPTDIMDLD